MHVDAFVSDGFVETVHAKVVFEHIQSLEVALGTQGRHQIDAGHLIGEETFVYHVVFHFGVLQTVQGQKHAVRQ